MITIINSFLFIFLAEIGDKTQLLSMNFAFKYSFKKVLLGIFVGSLLNHGLAVIIGAFLSNLFSFSFLKLIASISFAIFGILTLFEKNERGQEKPMKLKLSAIATISICFFMAELGDKTQLATIALSSTNNPFLVLIGTICGMMCSNCFGIILGKTILKKIPENMFKLISGITFLIFGIINLINF